MKKTELRSRATLTKQRETYKKSLTKAKKRITDIRLKLTKERNREQYLRGCIKAISERLGDIKDGQLEFKIEGKDV